MIVGLTGFGRHSTGIRKSVCIKSATAVRISGFRRRESSEGRGPGLDRDLQPLRQEGLLREVRAAQLQKEHGHQAAAVPQRGSGELSGTPGGLY